MCEGCGGWQRPEVGRPDPGHVHRLRPSVRPRSRSRHVAAEGHDLSTPAPACLDDLERPCAERPEWRRLPLSFIVLSSRAERFPADVVSLANQPAKCPAVEQLFLLTNISRLFLVPGDRVSDHLMNSEIFADGYCSFALQVGLCHVIHSVRLVTHCWWLFCLVQHCT